MTDKQIEELIKSNKNLFITGAGGTGKSYITNILVDKLSQAGFNVVTCASTGKAAEHINGITAHQLFHIPIPCFEPPSFAKNKKGAITNGQLKIIANIDCIIIDEISMLRNDAFSFAMKVMHKAERLKGSKIRLIVVGDFNQLPPVIKKEDEKLLKKFKFDTSGFCFTTKEWQDCKFKLVELKDVKRQDNKEFIEYLNKIREGKTEKKIFEYFNRFVKEDFSDFDDSDYIYICGTNTKADAINEEYLNNLPGELRVLKADKQGRCNNTYIDDLILVKEGCKVIFTANDPKGRYKNGSFGVLKKIIEPDPTSDDDFKKDGSVIVTLNGKDVFITKHSFECNTYSVKGGVLDKKTIGTIRQYPFKIGKAITIHKSQGQTFDKCIIEPTIFASGQLYVALSRLSSPDGLILTKEVNADMLSVEPEVKKFIKNKYKWEIKKTSMPAKTTRTSSSSTDKKTPAQKTVAKKPTTKKPASKSQTAKTKSASKTATTKKKSVPSKKSGTKNTSKRTKTNKPSSRKNIKTSSKTSKRR